MPGSNLLETNSGIITRTLRSREGGQMLDTSPWIWGPTASNNEGGTKGKRNKFGRPGRCENHKDLIDFCCHFCLLHTTQQKCEYRRRPKTGYSRSALNSKRVQPESKSNAPCERLRDWLKKTNNTSLLILNMDYPHIQHCLRANHVLRRIQVGLGGFSWGPVSATVATEINHKRCEKCTVKLDAF